MISQYIIMTLEKNFPFTLIYVPSLFKVPKTVIYCNKKCHIIVKKHISIEQNEAPITQRKNLHFNLLSLI